MIYSTLSILRLCCLVIGESIILADPISKLLRFTRSQQRARRTRCDSVQTIRASEFLSPRAAAHFLCGPEQERLSVWD
jgi:hypothetical protein